MNFTSEIPTKAGFYAWKRVIDEAPLPHRVVLFGGVLRVVFAPGTIPVEELGGLWCRLAAEDECVPKEEVEKAWSEGAAHGLFAYVKDDPIVALKPMWLNSRAKRVVEGRE
jgi:hypothetical protein